MTEPQAVARAQALVRQAAHARSRSRMLHAEVVTVAGQVADTEEAVAETLERLASHRPHRKRRLRAMSKDAAQNAARERQFTHSHARPSVTEAGNVA